MTTSGTYNFDPALGSLTVEALGLISVRPTAILAEHMNSARLQANLLLSEWQNRGVNLWTVDQQTQALTQGTANYTLSDETVDVLDVFARVSNGGTDNDRVMLPISRSDYAAIPNKSMQAPPNVFWFERNITPVLWVWPTPDASATYTLYYWRMRKIQDNSMPFGTTLDMPTRFADAFINGLAWRLARSYAPALEQARKRDYDEAWGFASIEDVENVPITIMPGTSGYYR